jgi:hypothetical protein
MSFRDRILRYLLKDTLIDIEKEFKDRLAIYMTPHIKEFSNLQDKILTVPQANYSLVSRKEPSIFWGIVDLSSMHHGDTVELILNTYSGGSPKSIQRSSFIGPLKDPIIAFPIRYLPGFDITLIQSSGAGCIIEFNFFWQLVDTVSRSKNGAFNITGVINA